MISAFSKLQNSKAMLGLYVEDGAALRNSNQTPREEQSSPLGLSVN